MRQEKIDKEVLDLKFFLELLGEDRIQFKNNEFPDFDAKIDNRTIGIELTTYNFSKKNTDIIESVKSTMNNIKYQLVDEIKSKYGNNILVNYSLRKPIPRKIKRKDKQTIFKFFLDQLELNDIRNNLAKSFHRDELSFDQYQNEFIEKIHITINRDLDKTRVTENDFYMFGVIPKNKIISIVDDKNTKMEFHRNKENWLVIFLEQYEHSDGIIDESVLDYDLTDYNFDRVFLIERVMKKIHEMNKCV